PHDRQSLDFEPRQIPRGRGRRLVLRHRQGARAGLGPRRRFGHPLCTNRRLVSGPRLAARVRCGVAHADDFWLLLALPARHSAVVWVLAAATVLYTAFHYGGAWSVWLNRVGGADAEAKQARAVHVQRGAGVLLLGVVPALIALGLGGGF